MRKTNVSPSQVVISSVGLFLPQTLMQGYDCDYTPISGVLMTPVRHRQTASTCSSNITASVLFSHTQTDSTLAYEQTNQAIKKRWYQEYSHTVRGLTINKPTARSPSCNKYTSFASLHCKSMFQVGYTCVSALQNTDARCKTSLRQGRLAFYPVYNNGSQPVGCKEKHC